LNARNFLPSAPPDDAIDERRDAVVRVVADALHELGNAIGVARHFTDHAGSSLDREVIVADLEEVGRALQRAASVGRDLNDTIRREGRPRSAVSAPAVVARAAERLRRAGVDEVSITMCAVGQPLMVATTREYTLESLVCTMAGLGRPAPSVHLGVSGGDERVVISVIRDRSMPGDDRDARNVVVSVGLLGGRASFHPDPYEWFEAEVELPSGFSAVPSDTGETVRSATHG
jgi:hypothetical protein